MLAAKRPAVITIRVKRFMVPFEMQHLAISSWPLAKCQMLTAALLAYFNLRGDRVPSTESKRFLRYLQSGRSLLAFVLTLIDQARHLAHQVRTVAVCRRNLLRRAILFDVVFKNVIQHVVVGKRVAVFLIGPQLR